MSVQVVSDLHLEATKAYDYFEIVPKAPTLALLGDIGSIHAHEAEFLGFLTRQLTAFRTVLFVPGNHEAYRSSWPQVLASLRKLEDQSRNDPSLGEFLLMDRTLFRVPDSNTVVLGCSLFSYVPPESHHDVSMGLNDFFFINDWDVDAHNEAHLRDVAWLNEQVAELEQTDNNIMIFTHWSPSKDVRAADPKHAGSLIASGFSTDLSQEVCFKSKKVAVWAFGHTHFNCDFTVSREDALPLRLLANQRGYFAEAGGFDAEKVVAV
ncbi:ser thr protein phosphatase [Colletotrichum truncatum]|uniref:Ser thr protein phosphatase n=1 Tax=Colletotrichum truncatum TaxID=5467 RepID=A0ACC3Z527_COLTU|nr:ser thr protein phosphatase [Colletotrichum truncatum]KAF6795059.1 ser thr protein phosphatase [Colletotrichum truncatum]